MCFILFSDSFRAFFTATQSLKDLKDLSQENLNHFFAFSLNSSTKASIKPTSAIINAMNNPPRLNMLTNQSNTLKIKSKAIFHNLPFTSAGITLDGLDTAPLSSWALAYILYLPTDKSEIAKVNLPFASAVVSYTFSNLSLP